MDIDESGVSLRRIAPSSLSFPRKRESRTFLGGPRFVVAPELGYPQTPVATTCFPLGFWDLGLAFEDTLKKFCRCTFEETSRSGKYVLYSTARLFRWTTSAPYS